MDSNAYGVPSFLRRSKQVGLNPVDSAKCAAASRVRETALSTSDADAAVAGASASIPAAARPSAAPRAFPAENEQQRAARLEAGASGPSSGVDAGDDAMADYYDNGDFGGGGAGGASDFDHAAVGRQPEAAVPRPAPPVDQPSGPPEPAFVTQHKRFVTNAPVACDAMTAATNADVSSRQSGYRHAWRQRAVMIANAWMKHTCCRAVCSQARLQGADAERLAAIKTQLVTVKDSTTDCVVIQVNSFFHAELHRLPKFFCLLCDKPYRALAVDFGCTQGSHELASNGTTQYFTNEFLDSVLPLWRRGTSFESTIALSREAFSGSHAHCSHTSFLPLHFRSSSRRHGLQLSSFWAPRRHLLGREGTVPCEQKKLAGRVDLAGPLRGDNRGEGPGALPP